MSRDIRITVDDDQFHHLDGLKDRYGYTWKGLLLEGSRCINEETAVSDDRNRLGEMVDGLREDYGDRDHYHTIRISSVTDERTGDEHLGIRVMLLGDDLFELQGELEEIDQRMYDKGYNTSAACESSRRSDEEFIPEGDYLYEGKTAALLVERGVPEKPSVPEPHRKATTTQNVHGN